MRKPDLFQQAFITTCNVPYMCTDADGRASAGGGVLRAGQAVWLQEGELPDGATDATAFVDGVGIICLEANWLARSDTTKNHRGDPALSATGNRATLN